MAEDWTNPPSFWQDVIFPGLVNDSGDPLSFATDGAKQIRSE
jgi:hypothetical protein